jgi:hypothetical protein
VFVEVPRPKLGELVREFGHETTLYNRELTLTVSVDGEQVAVEHWREEIYDAEANPDRYAIQQATGGSAAGRKRRRIAEPSSVRAWSSGTSTPSNRPASPAAPSTFRSRSLRPRDHDLLAAGLDPDLCWVQAR